MTIVFLVGFMCASMFFCYLAYTEGYKDGRDEAEDKAIDLKVAQRVRLKEHLEHDHCCRAKAKHK